MAIGLTVTLSDVATGQSPRWHRVTLGYGISLDVPGDWRLDDSTISAAMHSGELAIDAKSLRGDEGGHLIVIATPSDDVDAASLSMQMVPTRVSQADMAHMTDAEILAGEEKYFRPEAEAAARNNGVRITEWDGTRRRTIGGRYGLLASYRFKYPNGQEMFKQTFSAYLGSRALHIHIFRPAGASEEIVSALDHMIQSLAIAVDSL